MKIVFIGGRDIHLLGGIENYMLNLATQLVRMGHEPIVFCESDRNEEEMVNGFRVIHQKGPNSRFLCKPLLALKATIKTIQKMNGVDYIHYNAGSPALSAPIARLFGKRTILQGHGLEWQRSKYSRLGQRMVKCLDTVAMSFNKNLIMCSDVQTAYYQKTFGRKAVTIPTAINIPDLSKPNNSTVLERFGIVPNQYILYLARLVQDKNPDYLIRAFNKANEDGYQLVIAGNNPADEAYVKFLHELGATNENVIFTGPVYGEDKDSLLRNAYAFCIPSTIEGLSISLLEAMSYHLPIIASDIPANREVLEEDKAYWSNVEDVEDLSRAIKLSIHCPINQLIVEYNFRKVVEHYTWEKVAEKYVNYLMELMK